MLCMQCLWSFHIGREIDFIYSQWSDGLVVFYWRFFMGLESICPPICRPCSKLIHQRIGKVIADFIISFPWRCWWNPRQRVITYSWSVSNDSERGVRYVPLANATAMSTLCIIPVNGCFSKIFNSEEKDWMWNKAQHYVLQTRGQMVHDLIMFARVICI